MKNQALFSLKDKSKKVKCRLLQFLFGALRVKWIGHASVLKKSPLPGKDLLNWKQIVSLKSGPHCVF